MSTLSDYPPVCFVNLLSNVRCLSIDISIFFQHKKVFICHGPYPIVRAVLRKRGWVEKHYKGNLLPAKNKKNDSDGSDDDSCNSGDDSDNELSKSGNQSSCIKASSLAKTLKISETKTDNVGISKDDNDDDRSDVNNSDDDSGDNEDWNAGYEGNGPDCEFSLMVGKELMILCLKK